MVNGTSLQQECARPIASFIEAAQQKVAAPVGDVARAVPILLQYQYMVTRDLVHHH